MAVPLTLSTVPAQTPYAQYVATSGQTVFPYPFEITQDSDLVCAVNGSTLGTDVGYSLSGQGNSTGGFLTFTLGQVVGTVVTVYRNVTISRVTQLANNGTFFASNFNNEFNRIYLILQQLQEAATFSLQVPNTNNPAPVTTLTPALYANKYLTFDANGNPQPAVLTSSGTLTAVIITGLTNGQTAAEAAASVVPVSTLYQPGDPARYDTTGGTDYTAAFITSLSIANQETIVPARTYPISSLITCVNPGADKTVFFYPGAKILSSQPATTALGILSVSATTGNTIDRFRIVGNGVQIGYIAAPTVRINNTIVFQAPSITNIEITGLDIINGGNFGILLIGGLNGTVASGSTGAYIHDCKVSNTLGDGVHVDNFDGDVRIHNIDCTSCQDDNVAVLNYDGTSGYPTHPSQTVGVEILDIRSKGVQTSTVSISGVKQFIISNIEEEANVGFSVLTIKATHAAGNTQGNSAGVVSNVVTTGSIGVLAFDAPGAVTAANGTQFQQDMRFSNIICHNFQGTGRAVSLSNSGTAAGGQIKNIKMTSVELHGTGSSGEIAFIGNTDDVSLDLYADGFGAGIAANNNTNFGWGLIKLRSFAAGTSFAMQVTGSTVCNAGALDIDGTNCTTALQYQSNSLTVHNGMWTVVNGTTVYLFGSNSGVTGFFNYATGSSSPGSVTAGGTTPVTYAIPAGAAFFPNPSVQSTQGLRWGYHNASNTGMTLLWTDTMTNVVVSWAIPMQAA